MGYRGWGRGKSAAENRQQKIGSRKSAAEKFSITLLGIGDGVGFRCRNNILWKI